MGEPRNAVLVDVDGTLVDSNYFHAFPKAREFLVELADRGARVVSATSSKESDL